MHKNNYITKKTTSWWSGLVKGVKSGLKKLAGKAKKVVRVKLGAKKMMGKIDKAYGKVKKVAAKLKVKIVKKKAGGNKKSCAKKVIELTKKNKALKSLISKK